ncbi:MAG: hypothetical protein ACI9EF_003105 [Pseudohongiellaceae bacterium]|jgi:hypothetical protein
MRINPSHLGLVAMLALAGWTAPSASAQVCTDPGDIFWKNDILADNFAGVPPASHVAIAMCPDEAIGTYFQAPPGAPPQVLKQVSVGFAHTGGETNHGAVLSIEIYDGDVAYNPTGVIGMPTKIFDLRNDENMSMNITSSGLNTYDLTPFNVVVEGNFVVAFRMIANLSFPGCPGAIPGLPANFMTDSTTSCTPGLNVFEEKSAGWVDPADWWWSPFQAICPTYFSGNYVIRACTEDAGIWTDLGNGLAGSTGVPVLTGSGPLTAGSFNPIELSNTLPLTSTFFIAGFSALNAPLKGGILVPTPDILIAGIPTDATGGWSLSSAWPPGVPTGFLTYWQTWIPDAAGVVGFAATNGLSSQTP